MILVMYKMCNKFEVEDLNKFIQNSEETENTKSRSSPVFKFFNNTKTTSHKTSNLDSSDYDIPSYQVNQSLRSRPSSKFENETSESVLPFSPIFSPIPVASTLQFQPPSIHSLGTVFKNLDKTYQNRVNTSCRSSNNKQNVKSGGALESLGMTDKDISWISAMATPPPKDVPGSEFNTLEKATFFPEEKFQNIQPRALFSPTLDDDFGCQPIVFTSESEDNDEEYKSNIRLSDVCATLKHLEVKSLDTLSEIPGEKNLFVKDSVISPIIRTKKNKLGNTKKKKKGSLVMSPNNEEKYEFSVGESLKSFESEKAKLNCGSTFPEDDSFQSMSFSGIDELCKTLVSEQPVASISLDSGKTVTSLIDIVPKKFYTTKTMADVYEISSMDNLHSYAKALEECDKCNSGSSMIDKPLTEKGIVRFDIFNKDPLKVDAIKRSHAEITEGNEQCREKKLKKVDNENSGWENVKHYLSESQLNISDGEIFRTVENLEKTLASQESRDFEKLSNEGTTGLEEVTSQNSGSSKPCTETSGKSRGVPKTSDPVPNFSETNETKSGIQESSKSLPAAPLAFTTASGSKISVSEEALNKAKKFLKDCSENIESEKLGEDIEAKTEKLKKLCGTSGEPSEILKVESYGFENLFMKGFITGSGKQIKVSEEAMKKAKKLMAECENSETALECKSSDLGGDSASSFLTGFGKPIEVSTKVLEKAKTMLKLEDDNKSQFGDVTMNVFSTASGRNIPISEKVLEKAKALMVNCDKDQEDLWVIGGTKQSKNIISNNKNEKLNESPNFLGFSTGSGKQIHISAKSLEKAKALLAECEEKPQENLNAFKGFSTGSGKEIQVSTEALAKAKSLLKSCEGNFYECPDQLASERMEDLTYQSSEMIGKRTIKASGTKSEAEKSKPSFSTALGNKVKVSNKTLKKGKEIWFESVDDAAETPKRSKMPPACTESPLMGFVTAGGSKVSISEAALEKAKQLMNECEEMKMEDSGNFDSTTYNLKTMENLSEMKEKISKSEYNKSKMSTTSGIYESDDWEEIIPSWLHVYNTSPSITSERLGLSPIVCHEDGKSSNPDREYIVKSPVLGSGDRFHGKRKRRKLRFENEKVSQEQNQSGFTPPDKNSLRKTNAKRSSNLTVDFSAPFKKMKYVKDEVVEVDVDVKTERAKAREEQENCIKQKQKVKPLEGTYWSRKCSEKQLSWKEAVGSSAPGLYSGEYLKNCGVNEDILQINIENAESFRFKGENFFGSDCVKNTKGIPVGDGCCLILDNDNKFGVEELKRAFLASPGVQPNLIPPSWVENHHKWITWKLAHYEKAFPQYFGGHCLTPNNIMLQLKYRYDREIDRSERSALKKILERDDTSIKRLVLCVCGIKRVISEEAVGYELQVTDGWYSCRANSDPAMTRLIEEKKLLIGTKIVTQGATLINSEQGVSPLEINENIYLKIATNSTRRVRWDTKLGFQKNPENFPTSLGSILPQGGPISRIDVIIVRVYPMLYREKTPDGRHVTRNRRSEEKAADEYARIQEQRMETISSEIQAEMRTEYSSDQRKLENFPSSHNDRINLELREKMEKTLEKENLKKRNVSEFLRAKIVDFRKPDFNNPAILSVWNPSEELTGLMFEGKVISLLNVTISNSSRIYKPLQINTVRQTQYRKINRKVKYPARKLTQMKDVSSKVCPAFEEIDLVGMVALIQDVSYGSRVSQVVYLTDLEMNFVGIVFWGNCKDYAWENVLKVPTVVACSNLQWKKNHSIQDIPSLYVNENSVFTENPRHLHLKEEVERLKKNLPKDKAAFLSKCEEDITTKLEDSKWRTNTSRNSSGNDSTIKDTLKSRVNGFESKPTASSTPIKPFTTGMDSAEAEPSPIQKRIERLQSYGEPPSLIPLLVKNNTRRKLKKKN